MKEDVIYILQHKMSGFYLRDLTVTETLYTDNRAKARGFKPNTKADDADWKELLRTKEYDVVKRVETTDVKYEGVDLGEL